MSNQPIDETAPTHVSNTIPTSITPSPEPQSLKPGQKARRWPWIVAGIFLVILTTVFGGFIGYNIAYQSRLRQQANQVALAATTQYQLGLVDLQSGRYEIARQRFESVIRLDPNFPGAKDKLAETMLAMVKVATPTPEDTLTPTVYFTATPDTRSQAEVFDHAQALMKAQDWGNLILTLDILRKMDRNYRPLDVDGMYYMALRFRGVNKIIQQGNLEGGIYDLTLAETFGPLDHDAESYRNWARFYLTGASFWQIDWPKVLEYFGQIYPSLPNLRDGSGYTAIERYRLAAKFYGDELILKEDYCGARDQYRISLSISQDKQLAPTATAAQLKCAPPTPKPTKTPIIEPTQEIPTEEIPPTEEPTQEPPTVEPTTEPPPT